MILEMHSGIPQQTEVFVGRPGQSSLEGTGKLSEPGARALWSRRVHLHLFLSPSLGPFNAGDAWAWGREGSEERLLPPAGSRGRCAAIKVSLEDPGEGVLPAIRAPTGTASRRPPPASVALAGEQISVDPWWVGKG